MNTDSYHNYAKSVHITTHNGQNETVDTETNVFDNTVKSAYRKSAYKKIPVIRYWFSFPNHYQGTSSLYVYKELRLKETHFIGPDEFFIGGFYLSYFKCLHLNSYQTTLQTSENEEYSADKCEVLLAGLTVTDEAHGAGNEKDE